MEELHLLGDAIKYLKENNNHVIYRQGWNGKGMYVKICNDTSITIKSESKPLNEHFVIKNVDDSFSTWVPSVNDCLAADWVFAALK